MDEVLMSLYTTLYNDLVSLASVAGISENDLKKYFSPRKITKSDNILFRLCSSLQNSSMMRNSIKFNDSSFQCNRKAIGETLLEFNTIKAIEKYNNWKEVYNVITERVTDKGKGKNKETNWEKYCKGIYDGLQFLNAENGESKIKRLAGITEPTDEDFMEIINISDKIHGLGYALTCDWLKECGCVWLAKPDGHINSVIMHITGDNKIKENDVVREMFTWAKTIREENIDPDATAYKLDKIIWLLCTGDFYLDKIRIGREAIYRKIDSI